MKQLRLPIFTSKIKYYNLRIVPQEPVFGKVTAFKKLFVFAFGKQPLSKSKPHITIASFKMNTKHQDMLVSLLNQLSQNQKFTLHINGFGVFDTSKTLYLKVVKNNQIEAIHDSVQSIYTQHLKRKLKSFTISDTPHMSISKTTSKNMLHKSLKYFIKNDYFTEIKVDNLTLVSRSKYKTWDWEHRIKLS